MSKAGLINVGFGNYVVASRIVAVVSPDSSPMKRLRDEAERAGLLVDATKGRRTRSIIVVDSRHVVLSAVQAETVGGRFLAEEGQERKFEDVLSRTVLEDDQ